MKRRTARIALMLIVATAATASFGGGASLSGIDPLTGGNRTVELDGRLTHVVFFATWCPPCLAEFASLRDLEARWEPDGYRLVLVAIDRRETEDRLARFIGDESPPGLVLFDRGAGLQDRFRVDAVPGHILLGPGGAELFRASSLDEGVETAVETHLGSR